MNLELGGYTQEAYSELGRNTDGKLTQDIVRDITASWDFAQVQYRHPMAILIGGFQGSGKTTITDILNSDVLLPIISSDEIRYQLLQRNSGLLSEEFNPQVFAVRNSLISLLGEKGSSFILDQSLTLARVHLIENILKKNSQTSYKILRILLTAPMEILRERVSTRIPLRGKYQGTLEELENTVLKHSGFGTSRFHRVFNTGKLHPDEVAIEIKQMIKFLQE